MERRPMQISFFRNRLSNRRHQRGAYLLFFLAIGLIFFGVQATPAHAAISLVQSTTTPGNYAGTATAVSASFPSNNTAGNLIIVVLSATGGTGTATGTISDTVGDTFTLATSTPCTGAQCGYDPINNTLYYAKNIKGGANAVTFQWTSSVGYYSMAIFEYSGLSTSNPLDAMNSGSTSGSTTFTTGSSTTSLANELLFSFFGTYSTCATTANTTIGSGWAAETNNYEAADAACLFTSDRIVSSAGTYSNTFTVAATTVALANIATFGSGSTDVTSPSVAWTSPANNATVSSTINLIASSTDNVAVASVAFYEGSYGATLASSTFIGSTSTASGTLYSAPWNTTSLANGSTTLWALSTDTSNNTASVSTTVNIQNPLAINSFSASPLVVASAGTSTLSWNVTNASLVTITPGSLSTSTLIGSAKVNPTTSTTYTLTASNANGTSTATATVTVDTQTPTVPTGLTVVTSTESTVSLSWNSSTDSGASGLGGYYIYRCLGSCTPISSIGTVASTTTSYTDTGLSASTTYTYAVAAYSGVGKISALSGGISATTQASGNHLWSGIVDPTRAIDWSTAGIPGGIPNRTTICATINASTYGNGSTDATAGIQAALNSCASGDVVSLSSGTFLIDGGLSIPSNVTLRGQGANQTILNSNSKSATLPPIDMGTVNTEPNFSNAVSIASGATTGSTNITVSSASGMSVGGYLLVDQLNDGTIVNANGSEGLCTWCDGEQTSNGSRTEGQIVEIESINGNAVTISPGLYTNYSLTPLAVPFTAEAKYAGVENLQVYANNTGGFSNFVMNECAYCWLSGVEGNYTNGDQVDAYYSYFGEIVNSYFSNAYLHTPGSFDSDLDLIDKTSGMLVQNNILERLHTSIMLEWGAAGNVISYNYMMGNFDGGGAAVVLSDVNTHGSHPFMNLIEGNVMTNLHTDSIWGSSSDNTLFRNWVTGVTQICNPITGRGTVTCNGTYAVQADRLMDMDFLATSYNLVGDVVGSAQLSSLTANNGGTTLPFAYMVTAVCGPSPCGSGSRQYDEEGYGYSIGFGEEDDDGSSGFDSLLPYSTLFLDGEYNTITATTTWASGAQSLPASFYLSGKPWWWNNSVPWPAIGPDVTGGAGPVGHAYANPAELCYTSVMGGSDGGAGSPLNFNAATCYGSTDVTSPSVAWTSPANNATVSSTINLIASSTDNVAVASVAFYEGSYGATLANSALIGTATVASGTLYSVPWNTTSLTNGSTTLWALSTDTSNNTASASTTVNINNTGALPTITSFTASPTVVALNGTSTLSWNITNASSVAITPGSFSTSTLIGSTTTPALATSTSFTLTATNANGTSTSTPITITVSNTTSSPPRSLTAISGNTHVALSWSAPSSTGGPGLTQYLLYDRFTGSSTFVQVATTSPLITTSTVTSLTNGQSYDFEVIAQNAIGTSTPSNIVSSTPHTVPNSPTGISATVGNAKATVSFTPGSNGGSSILYFTATSNPSNLSASSTGSPIVVSGLANGQAYTFTVTATNLAGTSSNSSSSNSVTPSDTYPAISSFSASPADVMPGVSSTLSWTTINASSVFISQGIGNESATSSGSVIVSPSSTTIYAMTATNSNGSTTAQTTITVDGIPPSVPTSVTATAVSDSEIDLSWASSTDNLGVAGYDIYQNGNFLATTTALSYADTNLSAGATYTYDLDAFDAAGNVSATSTSVSATTNAASVVSSSGGGGGGGGGGGAGGGGSSSGASENTGGGGGASNVGGGYVATTVLPTSTADLESLIASLEAELNSLLAQAAAQGMSVPGGTSSIFTRNLTIGDQGVDVTSLQHILITAATGPVATSLAKVGATGYFGSLTQEALVEYQAAHGITPSTGYFGPKTKAYLEGGSISAPSVSSLSAAPVTSSLLTFGNTGSGVTTLQNLLAKDGYLSAGIFSNGTFDAPTLRAVQTFQCVEGIVCTGGYGYGYVGSKTWAALGE
jgi:hypothetical protein